VSVSDAAHPGETAVESSDGDIRVRIGLLVHADTRLAGEADRPAAGTFRFHRVRPFLHGRFFRRFEVVLNPDLAGGTLAVHDAYVDTILSPAVRIRTGKTKTPFGLERLHSASNLLFADRGLPTALVPNRDLGALGGVLSYQAGVTNGVPDGGSGTLDTNTDKDLSGRLSIRPTGRVPAGPLGGLGIAISGSRGRQEGGAAALPVFTTPADDQPYFSYSGAWADGIRTRYSPQVFYYRKSFGGLAEFVHTNTPIRNELVRGEIAHDAWQVAGSIVLTGETATDAASGVRPRANADFGGGHLGALQIAARYHVLKVDDHAIALGFATAGSSRKAEAWTVGLNWYLTGNLRYTLNFERMVFDDNPDGPRRAVHSWVFRAQAHL
jgi:phosphate-selective porin OprO/OprP